MVHTQRSLTQTANFHILSLIRLAVQAEESSRTGNQPTFGPRVARGPKNNRKPLQRAKARPCSTQQQHQGAAEAGRVGSSDHSNKPTRRQRQRPRRHARLSFRALESGSFLDPSYDGLSRANFDDDKQQRRQQCAKVYLALSVRHCAALLGLHGAMLLPVVMIMINSSAEAGPDDLRPSQYFVDPIEFVPSVCKKLRSHHRAAPKEVTCSKHVYIADIYANRRGLLGRYPLLIPE